MPKTTDILAWILGGGKKPEPGSQAAISTALLIYHYRARKSAIGGLLIFAVLAPVLWRHFGYTNYFAIFFCMNAGRLGGFGSYEDTWHNEAVLRLLPVDAKSAFRWRFFPGLIFVTLLPAGALAVLLLMHADIGYHSAIAAVGLPACVFAAGFIVHRITASTLLLAALAFIVLVVAGFMLVSVFGDFFYSLCLVFHPLAYVTAVVAIHHLALLENLRRQFVFEEEMATGGTRKKPEMPRLLWPTNAVAIPRPVIATPASATLVKKPSASLPEKPAREISDAIRRRALFDFLYDGKLSRAKWITAIWACLLIPFPPFIQFLLHLLGSAFFHDQVCSRRWRFNPLEGYAALLPATRTEIFLLRYGPLFVVQLALGLFGLFCACVLNVPGAWLGGRLEPVGLAMSPAALFAGPMLTTLLALGSVYPKTGGWIGTTAWVLFLFGEKIAEFLGIRLGPVWETLQAHPALIALGLAGATGALLAAAHAGFLKKEIPQGA